ncbi:hypothetical protein [Mangrovimonas spongiae]|uniref:Lipoprotein n=1 Tax=Mangrovimonas spongiae TaxID=2494697 RepID=A0A428K4S4_9FLAO|nr:hypothetical protein [Mangrovimonas spongiae]RSK41409.1 hypothetical protein EJA19_00615 [Mangrovimonas spongiae]
MHRKVIFIIMLLTSLFSCKKESNEKGNPQVLKKSSQVFSFEFYDKNQERVNEILKDSEYIVVIRYKSNFDTITKNLYTEGYPERALFFHKMKDQFSDKYLEEKSIEFIMNNFSLDTILARNNRGFIFETGFNKRGENYINGIIEDFVHLKTSDTDKIRLISEKTLVSQKVLVK